MDNLEQQCEDALFEVCDARERYPLQCAKEFEKCIKLVNEIKTTKVVTKPAKNLDMPTFTDEQIVTLQKVLSETTKLLTSQEDRIRVMLDKIDNLKAVVDQIKRDKSCEINKLLWN